MTTEQTSEPISHDQVRTLLRALEAQHTDIGLDVTRLLAYVDTAEFNEKEVVSVKAGYNQLDANWEKMHEACMGPIREAVGDRDASLREIVSAILTTKKAIAALFGERKCAHCGKEPTCFGSYEDSEYAYACDECCGHACEDGRCVPVVDVEQSKLMAVLGPHLRVMKDCVSYVAAHGHVQKDSADADEVRKTNVVLAGLRF